VVVDVRVEEARDAAPVLRGRALWRRWTVAVTLGEAAGFCIPATAGAVLAALDAPFPVLAPVALLAGLAEGAILGAAQAGALRRALPAVPSRRWIAATAKGALVAWAIGLIPFAVELRHVPTPVLIVAGGPLGALLLTAIGAFQARELRGHVAHPRTWICTTAAAWAAGLAAFTAVTSPLWQQGQAAPLVAAIGVLGGLTTAATVAAATGAALVHLTRGQ
jgi:fluoride ion exporter CrcB/FEX